jgi:Protein of unknown function (DUF2947)
MPGSRATGNCRPGTGCPGTPRTAPNWYTYANDPQLPDAVAAFLRESLPWPEAQVAFYAHRRRCVYRLPWGVFVRHWRRFMVIDESWVFGLGRPEFALFADAGGLAVGDMRPEAEPSAAADRRGM